MNEVNLRNSFNLLSKSKIQESKLQKVLTQVTDGILIMQHTQNDNGIVLVNPAIRQIFRQSNDAKIDGERRVGPIFDEIFGGTRMVL